MTSRTVYRVFPLSKQEKNGFMTQGGPPQESGLVIYQRTGGGQKTATTLRREVTTRVLVTNTMT